MLRYLRVYSRISARNYAQFSTGQLVQKHENLDRSNVNQEKGGNLNCKRIGDQEFLVKLKNDPDKFGSDIKTEIVDKGDLQEDDFFEQRALPSQKLSTKKYANLIKSLIKQRRIKEAIDVLEVKMLKEHQFKPENYIYNLLLGACGKVGYTKKAFSLYNDMKKRGLKVTGGTYTALFNACSNSPWPLTDGLTRAKHLRNIMTENMYEPNDTNYNAMIKAFGRCGDLSTAFSIVDEMMRKKMIIKDDTLNFILQSCITDKESGFRHTLLVWQKMKMLNIKPSLFTFNLILRAVRDCGLGDIRIAHDVISQILGNDQILIEDNNKLLLRPPDEGPIPDPEKNIGQPQTSDNNICPNLMAPIPHLGTMISISEVIRPEDRLLLIGGMSGFLEILKTHDCSPNIKTFTQLLDVIPNTTAAENQLLSIMKKSNNMRFDIDFFNMLIKKRSMRLEYNHAKDVLKLIAKYNMRPNLVTYGVLALGCKTKEEAQELLQEMKLSKYRLNAEILGAMLQQACFHKKFSYIFEIMEICIKEGIQPNKKFIEHLDKFKKTCRRMINDKDSDLGQSKIFQNGFQMFRLRYSTWLKEVKIEDTEDIHPWQEFKEPTDPNMDKYYKDNSRTFKSRHISKFRVKTSPQN